MNKKNKHFIIKKEGSLGLLALGDIGLRSWRKVKQKDKTQKNLLDEEE